VSLFDTQNPFASSKVEMRSALRLRVSTSLDTNGTEKIAIGAGA